jgi:hypothetical protein
MRIEYVIVGFVLIFIVLFVAMEMLGGVGKGFEVITKFFR